MKIPVKINRFSQPNRGMSSPKAAAPWELARQAGNAHFKASKWAHAIISYTIGLACNETPPEAAIVLYCNRAAALVKQGGEDSFVHAGEDARAGLALFSDSELFPAKIKLKLTLRAREADLGALGFEVERAARLTSQVSITAQTVIPADSLLGTALGDLDTTAYFFEAQFRAIEPGSTQRFLATVNVYSSIALFATGPDCRAFGAHFNFAALLQIDLDRDPSRGDAPAPGSMFLDNMSRALQRAFRDVDPSEVTIKLVGGHEKTDYYDNKNAAKSGEEATKRYSDLVRRCVAEALPGASVDTSLLHRFEGGDACDWFEVEHACCVQGQRFQVVVLDSHTGKVVTQTKYTDECVEGKIGPVPESVLRNAATHFAKIAAWRRPHTTTLIVFEVHASPDKMREAMSIGDKTRREKDRALKPSMSVCRE